MASGIAESGSFACLDAFACHVRLKTTDDGAEGQYETKKRIMNYELGIKKNGNS
jgi:hypothetical protein